MNEEDNNQLGGMPQDNLLVTVDQMEEEDARQQKMQDELTKDTTVSETPSEQPKKEESKPFVSGRDTAGT